MKSNIAAIEEVWVAIDKSPYAEVSNYGNVRTLDRYITNTGVGKGGGTRLTRGQILKPFINKRGTPVVELPNKKKSAISVLVANAFGLIKESQKYKYIKHKDGDKANNHVSNLEWTEFRSGYKLDEETREKAIEMYLNSKLSLDVVAEAFGMTRGALKRWIVKSGGKIRTNAGWRDHELMDIIAKEYAEGGRTNELAKKYNVSRRTIFKWLTERDVQPLKLEDKIGHTKELREKIIDLYVNEKLNCAEISRLINVPQHWAFNVVYDMRRTTTEINKLMRKKGVRMTYYGNGGYIETKFGDMPYDSTYERDRILLLNKDDSVKTFERCKYKIPYIDNTSKSRRYFPDLFIENVDGTMIIEEVKPVAFIDKFLNPFKFEAARIFCNENGFIFRIITEKEIYG